MMIKLVLLGENLSVHVQKWIKGLKDHGGIEIHVISFRRGIEVSGVQYHWIKRYTKTKLDYFLNVFKVRKYILDLSPDIVHAHHSTSHGFLAAMSNFNPIMITGWGSDILDSPKNPVLRRMLTKSFEKAAAITVLSHFTKEAIRTLTPKDVKVIPFGVDISKFSPPTNKNLPIKIGTIRTLSEKYGVEYLIRSFAIVAKKHKDVQLEIVGNGPQFHFLRKLSVDLGVGDKVLFHGFVNQNKEPTKYLGILKDLDVFTMLSVMDSETFGVAGVEAMSCGIPVVASNIGGLAEVVGDTGLIVPPRDIEATANALDQLISNKEFRLEKSEKARKKVLDLYDWKKNVESMVSLYQAVIKNER